MDLPALKTWEECNRSQSAPQSARQWEQQRDWEGWRDCVVGEAGEVAAVCVGAGASWLLTLAGWQEDVLDQLCG